MSSKYKLTIAYDGTRYHGWQIQPNGISIQEVIHNTFKIFLQEDIHLIGSGRTDAGVHALAQIAHFTCGKEIDTYRFLAAANGLLPPDIRVLKIDPVPANFHAQYDAKGKIYHYHLHLDAVQNPFHRLYSLHVRKKISQHLLIAASQEFLGTHDFTSFANAAHEGSASRDAVRTIKRIDVIPEPGGVRIEIEADGFLYKMVRNIVGIILEVAAGQRALPEISQILLSRNRCLAGVAVPPQGLFLAEVHY